MAWGLFGRPEEWLLRFGGPVLPRKCLLHVHRKRFADLLSDDASTVDGTIFQQILSKYIFNIFRESDTLVKEARVAQLARAQDC